ncbi:heavy metal translocating P-type ATPase [Phormidium sp. CCY1219]|uniref:heavy metal translocating P-type ATPase n=1 Tax=Phormidium sp. CCY1219 TaxID=2886104 RepID=UPI002D1E8926|nr:heavy metal translocating P-type ATPase [Phormidium sp. CCY1219]MEB3829195.1 heavy metal translocating P-type ATPase [Phormidium sp. CCY1219]
MKTKSENREIEPIAPYQVTDAWIACCVVHAIPGRVRFRVPRLAGDTAYGDRLVQGISAAAEVTQVRVNVTAASVVICYKTHSLSDEEVRSRCVGWIQTAVTAEKVQGNPPAAAPVEKAESETADWSDLKAPAIATVLAVLSGPLRLPIPRTIVAASVATAAWPVAKRAIASLLGERRINIDCLDMMAIALSSLRGNLVTPALVMTLHELGDTIRDRTARASAAKTADLLDTLGHYAWVEREGEKRQIPATEVQVGETAIVYPGEQIPVDGQVLRGQATIDTQKLTGESMPIVADIGTTVYASTLVRSGEIYVKAERVGAATRAAASLELVRQAPVHDTRMENYAANIADRAILPASLWAAVVWAFTRDPGRAAAILTLDFVTGLRVSLPTTLMAALTHATRHGILIRSGRALEQLAEVDTIVFDKTGTLTCGDISVVKIEPVAGRLSEDRLLELTAAAEQRITHPVAEAVMDCARDRNLQIPPRGEWHYEVGLGIRAEIDGHNVLVGSDRFLLQEGIDLDCLYEQMPCLGPEGCEKGSCLITADCSLIYVACDREFQGVIQYADPLRSDSGPVIRQLQGEYGLELHLLTGDDRKRAIAVGQELALPEGNIHAEAFPEEKATIVRQLHESGKTVAFAGDGLNDSVALAYADVSISFGNGSDVARETADVVLMNNDLYSLLEAIAIAKETQHVIQQNIGLSVAPNIAALAFASTVGLHPLAATAIHNGSAIAAGLNGLRPLMHVDPPTPAA